jgi:hypothetical protein
VLLPVFPFFLPFQRQLTELCFDSIQGTNLFQRFGAGIRLGIFGFKEVAAAVCPTLSMGQAGFFCVFGISGIAIRQQNSISCDIQTQYLGNMFATPTFTSAACEAQLKTAVNTNDANSMAALMISPSLNRHVLRIVS